MELKTHGITKDTPKNLMFGSGAYYKNLKYSEGAWSGEVLGATSGGGKLTITQEFLDAELDGASVLVRGAKNKVGEMASIETNLTEFKEGLLVDALHLAEDTSEAVEGFKKFTTKDNLEDSDYLENIAFVGALNDGRNIIVIMENAFCTSAFEIETKNKTQVTYACKFDCHATFEQARLNKVPVYIYYPNATEEATV